MTDEQLRDENTALRRALANERDRAERLQMVLDSRPAINAGLPESYVRWSAQVGEMEFLRAVCQEN